MSKKLFSIILVVFMVTALSCCLFACNVDDTDDADDTATQGGTSYQVQDACSYVSIDINPAISITVDENDYVVSVYGENEDGQILLYGETEGIVGKDLETALDKIISLAVELGYIDENNTVVGTTVTGVEEIDVDALIEKVNGKIKATAQKAGITVEIDEEGAFTMLRDLEALKEKHPNNPAIQGLSASRYQLIISASETGEIDVEGAVELDDKELIDMVSKSHKEMKDFVTDAYKKAKDEAKAVYDKALGMANDAVYVAYYLEHVLEHSSTCYLGAVYQMYASTARGLEAIADSLKYVEKYSDYELTSEQIATVMAGLGIEDETLIQNEDGVVTITSIEEYVDKTLKNMERGEEYEEFKADVIATLEEAELSIKEKVKVEVDKYAPIVRNYMQSVESYVTALDSFKTYPLIGEKVEEYVTDYQIIVDKVIAVLDGENLDEEELRSIVLELEEKAKAVLELIKEDLGEEGLEEIEERKDQVEASMSTAKDSFENAIKQAEQNAKDRLEDRKNDRFGGR